MTHFRVSPEIQRLQLRVSRLRLLAVVTFYVLPITLAAQSVSCKGPSDLEQSVASNPSATAFNKLGTYFAGLRQYSCAISAFESAIRLAPNAWEGRYNLGLALLSSGDSRRAAQELETASRLKPSDARILLPLGMSLSNLGQQEAAVAVFKTILNRTLQSVPALDGLTKALIAEGRYAAAIAVLKDAPSDEALRLNLAVAYSKNDNPEQAIQILSAIVKEHPSTPSRT